MKKEDLKDKNVVVVGLGRSGIDLVKFLYENGAKVTATDSKSKSEFGWKLDPIKKLDVEFELGRHPSKAFMSADYILVSPGVPWDLRPIQEAIQAGKNVMGEFEFAASFYDCPIIAVTGTNGKTTTATITAEMLNRSGKKTLLAGNIGIPLTRFLLAENCDKDENKDPEAIVLELSSFQAEQVQRFRPNILIYTTLTRDHIDRHGSEEAYYQAKIRLMRNMTENDLVVLNYTDPRVRELAGHVPGRIAWALREDPFQGAVHFREGFYGAWSRGKQFLTYVPDEESFSLAELKIIGSHNRENLLMAAIACLAIGGNRDGVQDAIDNFKGVENRLEFVRKKDGVSFFNDSMATNVAAVETALKAFKENVILLMGGRDKDEEFEDLIDIVCAKVKTLILIGEAKEKINRAIGDECETFLVGSFEEACLIAFQKSRGGDIVLLSPGCSSLDMFRDYEERGDYFKKLVNEF